MKNQDAELIQSILDGEQSAFTTIVEKYQKAIHAHAWQKIGDFHVAQEIAQDTFLKAYQNLGTLKNPKLFGGWLYVIATNVCNDWLRKKRLPIQSLDTVDTKEVEQVAYKKYQEEQLKEDVNESRRELVRNLLKKLPESERTVMTLHYLGEMTIESIGGLLGVSQNTIKSRLSRARNRLRKEESMIRENLNSFQLPKTFTEEVMEKIMNTKPITPSATNPLVPLAISAATAILAILLIGVGTQQIFHFQHPYSLDALSEQSIEITDAELVIDTPIKPKLHSPIVPLDSNSENNGPGHNEDSSLTTDEESGRDAISDVKGKLIQAKALEGGVVPTLFATTRGDIFAGTISGLYRLTDEGSKWELIKTRNAPSLSLEGNELGWGAMFESGNTLYLATNSEVLASVDRGNTWKTLGSHPGGLPIGFVITDNVFYIGLTDKIFRSDDNGVTWEAWSLSGQDNSQKNKSIKIRSIESIENTVFVGTDNGLFRLNDDTWEEIQVGQGILHEKVNDIHGLAVAGDQLYAVKVVTAKKQNAKYSVSIPQGVTKSVPIAEWSLYQSSDKGNTWKLIANKKNIAKSNRMYFPLQVLGPRRNQFPYSVMGPNFKVKVAAIKGRVVVVDTDYQSYSSDQSENWQLDDTANIPSINETTPTPVLINPYVIYKSNVYGILRSLDGGKTWQRFNSGLTGDTIWELFFLNETLYAYRPNGIIISKDGGESWTNVFLDSGDMTVTLKKSGQRLYARTDRMLNIITGPTGIDDKLNLNVKHVDEKVGYMNILRILSKNNGKSLIRETPTYKPKNLPDFRTLPGNFAVSGSTFYADSNNNIYRWKPGATGWYNTKLVDKFSKARPNDVSRLEIAASAKMLYVGMNSGHLMQSLNEGEIWTDVTANLPFAVDDFKSIVFAGDIVYVATDKGVVQSDNGIDWHTLTDTEETPLVVNRFSVHNTSVYGESDKIIYQVSNDTKKWKQVTPRIVYPVSCFDTDGKTLYVGTYGSGLLRYSLDDESNE